MAQSIKGSKPVCSIEGCNQPIRGRGWCTKHYQRWSKYGDPLVTQKRPHGTSLAWLKEQVAFRDRSECWVWPFNLTPDGYGTTKYNGGRCCAHGLAMILDGRPQPAPPNHHALHSCDNPPCCNPDHSRWGTHLQNLQDMQARNRQVRGSRIGVAVLTEDQVRLIKADLRTARAIALDYGVHESTIGAIRLGRTWRHVNQEAIGRLEEALRIPEQVPLPPD